MNRLIKIAFVFSIVLLIGSCAKHEPLLLKSNVETDVQLKSSYENNQSENSAITDPENEDDKEIAITDPENEEDKEVTITDPENEEDKEVN